MTPSLQDDGFIHFALGAVKRLVLPYFVFALAAPLTIALLAINNAGFSEILIVLVKILVFPAFIIQGKQAIDLSDLVVAFVAWGLILEVINQVLKYATKGKVKLTSSIKALHVVCLAVYAIAFASTPFLKLADGTSVWSIIGILAVFFVIGYINLGILWGLDKLTELLNRRQIASQVITNVPSQNKRKN